ncbi:hypothetical protein GP486_005896 [Trichoglossum hirsutum]|uniref:DUF7924 domain-containing protein n=1 Tax=Trichoglossum hirsutum TaxID=265104 RepID=A0A9P8L8D8_9PEZI|nr:hypothetical protein GP486_005896 [Trichoglossum hirsutum]
MAGAHGPAAAQKRRRGTAPDVKDVSKSEPRRRLRSLNAKGAQQLQKYTVSHLPRSSPEENRPSPPKTLKRPREAEVEQATDHRPAKRSRKLVQQPLPAQQPKDRKRPREALEPLRKNSAEASRKRTRRSLGNTIVETSVDQETASTVGEGEIDPIGYWTKTYHYPKGYAEQSDDTTSHLLARKKSAASLHWKRSELASIEPAPSSTTPSDQKPREAKSAPYQDPRCEALLATKGSFMDKSDFGLTKTSKTLYRTLLDKEQAVPQDSLFRDDLFEQTCQKIRNRNEARVIQDITQLIVPSAEALTTHGATNLRCLIESVNEAWNNSMPLTGTRPQPDYSVGFKREAFTKDQLDKLSPFIGDFITGDQSYFMATYYMYFPFFTCEVKCGATALDIADRQNAHSMTLSVRAIVELFRLVGREMELHREILAFSISHDHRSVRIYGHYPVIDGKDTEYYRNLIRTFDFTELDGKEKWTAYRFTKSVYDTWMPAHFERLCSAIDKIPADLDFSVPQLSQSFGPSQDLERHRLSESTELESLPREPSQQSISDAGDTTPNTSFTRQGAPKRPRKRPAAG